jgi:CRP-like cAMP-binding protein
MADAIGTSREYVSRQLGRFESAGLLRREKGWIVVAADSPFVPPADPVR